jgi:hypothetical protein
MLRIFFLSMVLGLLVVSCKTKAKIVGEVNNTVFSLTKGQCDGLCSRYNIYVLEDLNIQYEGLENVDRYGLFQKKLTKQEYSTLVDAYAKAGFLQMKDQYSVDIVDFPLITMSYNNGKVMKKVEGRTERPKELLSLQQQLERLATASNGKWETIKEYPPNRTNVVTNQKYTKGDRIENQIIIKPKANVALGPWLRGQQKFGVSLVKKISDAGNLWLISYDIKKISPENMMAALKADTSIESAEFNMMVSPREH